MIVLVTHLWPGLAAVAVIGLAVAATAHPSGRIGHLVLLLAALLWCLALLAAGLGSLDGRAALWLDSGLLHGAAFAGGLAVGWVLRRLRAPMKPPQAGHV